MEPFFLTETHFRRDLVYRDGALIGQFEADDWSAPNPPSVDPNSLELSALITDHRGDVWLQTFPGSRGVQHRNHLYPYGERVAVGQLECDDGRFEIDSVQRYAGHERDRGACLNVLDDVDYMHARYYQPGHGRFLSVDPINSFDVKNLATWNRYSYGAQNPLKYVDPDGMEVDLSGLGEEQIEHLIDGLNEATGNTYSVTDGGLLQLDQVGENSSETATAYVNGLIGMPTSIPVFEVIGEPSSGKDGVIRLNFDQIANTKLRNVERGAFNLGTAFIHEALHVTSGLFDTPDGADGPRVLDDSYTGPIVDMVNTMREERGFSLRLSYGPAGLTYGGNQKIRFGRRAKRGFRSTGSVARPNP